MKDNLCKHCGIKVLPDDESNLQTLLGFNLKIHAPEYYILELPCHYCGMTNYFKREGSKKAKEIKEGIDKIFGGSKI